MDIFQGSPHGHEESYLLHAKISLDKLLELDLSDDAIYSLLSLGTMLTPELAKAYAESLNAPVNNYGGIYSIIPYNENKQVLIYKHESGPEVLLLPIASFVGGAIVSGIIGNLAYDILKDLYHKTENALRETIKEWNEAWEKIDWSADEPIQIGSETIDEREVSNLFEIRLITPGTDITYRFEKDKGLSQETINSLIRRISRYQKESRDK